MVEVWLLKLGVTARAQAYTHFCHMDSFALPPSTLSLFSVTSPLFLPQPIFPRQHVACCHLGSSWFALNALCLSPSPSLLPLTVAEMTDRQSSIPCPQSHYELNRVDDVNTRGRRREIATITPS